MLNLNILDSRSGDFGGRLQKLLDWQADQDPAVVQTVTGIIAAVRRDGDRALLDYTRQFDGLAAKAVAELELPPERLQQALATVPVEQRRALEAAAARIERYARQQLMQSWSFTDELGNVLGQQVQPLERVVFTCRAARLPTPRPSL
jgi:histidinol dehydrogenase